MTTITPPTPRYLPAKKSAFRPPQPTPASVSTPAPAAAPTPTVKKTGIKQTPLFAYERQALGQGGFGTVHRGVLGACDENVSVKKVRLGVKVGQHWKQASPAERDRALQEARLLSETPVHRNVLHAIEGKACVVKHRSQDASWYADHPPKNGLPETARAVFIFTPLLEARTLHDHLHDAHGGWSLSQTHACFTQILRAVVHLHSNNVAHRDLKPANILRDAAGNWVLADFGLATEGSADQPPRGDGRATTTYAPPEVVRRSEVPDARTSDLWMLGILLFEMLTQRRPFCPDMADPSPEDIRAAHLAYLRDGTLPWGDQRPQGWGRIVESLLDPVPARRPSARQLLSLFENPMLQLEGAPSTKPEGVQPERLTGRKRPGPSSAAPPAKRQRTEMSQDTACSKSRASQIPAE